MVSNNDAPNLHLRRGPTFACQLSYNFVPPSFSLTSSIIHSSSRSLDLLWTLHNPYSAYDASYTAQSHQDIFGECFRVRLARIIVQVVRQQPHGCPIQHVGRASVVIYPVVLAERPYTPSKVHGIWAPVFQPSGSTLDLVRQQVLYMYDGEFREAGAECFQLSARGRKECFDAYGKEFS